MFKNPGKKLKTLAKVVFFISLLCYILAGVGIIMGQVSVNDNYMTGVEAYIAGAVVILLGIVFSWLLTIFLYAAGSAVDDIQTIKKLRIEEYKRSKPEL